MRSSRGNVLLMAICISVFLFFVSVALVTSNRQNILLALNTDNRLKAQLAARGGSELSLERLRRLEKPEEITTYSETFASGASFDNEFRPYGPDERLRLLRTTGRSSYVTAERDYILEPITMMERAPAGHIPLLFARQGGNLKALGPSFQWTDLGSLPRADTPLAAGGGPLVVRAPLGSAEPPPQIMDFAPVTGPDGRFRVNGLEPVQWPSVAPEHLVYLTFSGQKPDWNDLPDPQFLGTRMLPPAIDGDPQGTPTLDGDGYPTSRFTGPVVHWWALSDGGLTCESGVIYSHAIHYCYRGTVLENGGEQTPGQLLQAPAVLAGRLSGDRVEWKSVVDLMTIPEDGSLPEILPGPRPNPASLAVIQGIPYALQSDDPRKVLRGGARSWTAYRTTEGLGTQLVTYRNELLVPESGGLFADRLSQRTVLTGLDPQRDLHFRQPQANARIVVPLGDAGFRDADVGLQGETLLEVDLPVRQNPVATLDADLYVFGRVRRTIRPIQGVPPLQEVLPNKERDRYPTGVENTDVLLHYDGKRWQVWPSGLAVYLPWQAAGAARGLPGVDPGQLALGLYRGEETPRTRYGVVLFRR